jgi:hypothetical protein
MGLLHSAKMARRLRAVLMSAMRRGAAGQVLDSRQAEYDPIRPFPVA